MIHRRRRDVILFLRLLLASRGAGLECPGGRDEAPDHRQGPDAIDLGRRSPDRARRFTGGICESRGRRGEGRLPDLHLARSDRGHGAGRRATTIDERTARHRPSMVARRDAVDLRPDDRKGRQAAATPALSAVVRRGRAETADQPSQRGLIASLVARWEVPSPS